MNDTIDHRRGSVPQGSPWDMSENLAMPATSMPRAHSISYPPQAHSRQASMHMGHPNLGVTIHPNNLHGELEFCDSCSRVLPQIVPMVNGSTPFINPGPMADVNPLYTYSVNVILPSPPKRAAVPGFSFDHDTIQSIASSLEEFLWQHQQGTGPRNLLAPKPREELPVQDTRVQEPSAWRWEEEEYTLPWQANRDTTSSSGPSRDPSIRNLLNNPIEHIDPAQLSSDTVDTIMNEGEGPQTKGQPRGSILFQEEDEEEEENGEEGEEGNGGDGMSRDAQSAAGGLDDIEDAIENLSQLGLDAPVPQPVAADLWSCKPGLSEFWGTPKSVTSPSSGNNIWISSCFFVGLGVNSVGRYEYTQMILPRRPGERVEHVATTTCDKCGTVVMYGRYNSPEVMPEHPRVSVYILRLEAELVKPYVSIIQPYCNVPWPLLLTPGYRDAVSSLLIAGLISI